jgi:hypothetical protein
MKKYFLLSILGIFMLPILVSASEVIVASASPSPDIVICLRIIFHKPKYDCERGFGLCLDGTVGLEGGGSSASAEKTCPVKMQLNQKNQLILEVTEVALKEYENGSTLPYFEGKTSITFDESYPVPQEICRQLGTNQSLTIKAGTYPVTYSKGTYTVVFQL